MVPSCIRCSVRFRLVTAFVVHVAYFVWFASAFAEVILAKKGQHHKMTGAFEEAYQVHVEWLNATGHNPLHWPNTPSPLPAQRTFH